MEVDMRNRIEIEEGRVEASLQNQNKGFGGTSAYLTFTALVLALLFQYFNQSSSKGSKKLKGKLEDEKDCVGIDDLPGPTPIIPTPFNLLGNIPQLLPLTETLKTVEKWTQEFGDIFKVTGLGQKFVVLNSGPTIQILLKSSDFSHIIKAPIAYDLAKPFITNGVIVSKGTFWQKERKILLRSQTYQSLKAYMPMMNKHCGQLVKNLETHFADGKSHEINCLINTTFLRIVTEMLAGNTVDNTDEFDRYYYNLRIWKEALTKRVMNPLLLPKPFWKLHPLSKKHDQAVDELFEFARKRIKEVKERRERKNQQNSNSNIPMQYITTDPDKHDKPAYHSVLDELVDVGLDERQIIDEFNSMLFAGHETGAGTIQCLCFAFALNQEIQELARKEIDELFEDTSQFKNGAITYDAVQSNLKYVEHCVLETLRLFPPIFAFARKLDAPLKFEHEGKTVAIPAGVNVVVSPFILQRRPDIYPDPYKFDPDRFLPEESAKRHAYSYIPFSAGPRNCLGQKFAMIEMKLVIAYILRHFELTTTDRMEDVPLLPYVTLTPAKDYTFCFKKRIVS